MVELCGKEGWGGGSTHLLISINEHVCFNASYTKLDSVDVKVSTKLDQQSLIVVSGQPLVLEEKKRTGSIDRDVEAPEAPASKKKKESVSSSTAGKGKVMELAELLDE